MRRRRNRADRQRGAVLVEFAIVAPIFMILVLGIFEIGKAWEANQTVVQAARGGARTVAQLGTNNLADQQGVASVVAAFGPDAGDIVRVVVYEADAAGGFANPLCANNNPPASANCNVYLPVDIAQANNSAYFDSTPANDNNCGTGASNGWCPDERSDLQTSATFVGVLVEFREERVSGFFGTGTYTITERTVMRVEPEVN